MIRKQVKEYQSLIPRRKKNRHLDQSREKIANISLKKSKLISKPEERKC
jgi:hypothetical protein